MKKAIVIIILLIIIISGFLFIICTNKNNSNGIPIININLNNTTLKKITTNSKEIKYKNNSIKIYGDDFNLKDNNVTIKGRGNTTWNWIKKPFQIKFDKKVNLLNLGNSKKWILLANYTDETLIRNHMAFYLGMKIGLNKTLTGINVDLYIDNEYQGVYYLVPKIAIDTLNLNKKNSIIMELDNKSFVEEENYYISIVEKDHLVVKDISNEKKLSKIADNFMKFYNNTEKAILNKNWNEITKYIDVESFAKYYIVNTLVENKDAYRSSFYMYKNGSSDKIHAGPIWDFDLAFSNAVSSKKNLEKDKSTSHFLTINGPIDTYRLNEESKIVYKLLEFNEFKEIVKNIWNSEMLSTLDDSLTEVDKQYEIVKSSATKNIKKWNYPATYKEYIDTFKTTISNLYKKFDNKINNLN